MSRGRQTNASANRTYEVDILKVQSVRATTNDPMLRYEILIRVDGITVSRTAKDWLDWEEAHRAEIPDGFRNELIDRVIGTFAEAVRYQFPEVVTSGGDWE